jgi:outer membrane protein OmpA-like peptidoglycan-associated protein
MKAEILLVLSLSPLLLNAQPSLQPIKFHGKITDAKTHSAVDAELDVYFDSDFILDDVQLTNDGKFTENLSKRGWYIIEIKAAGYLNHSDTLWITDEHRLEIERNYLLTPIEVGLVVELKNIYFHFGTTTLKPDSFQSLDIINAFFNANQGITFEIAGHTDDEGAEDYNMTLSQGRAQSIVDYLVKKGVDSSRLIARGYGESNPIDTGITKAAKARNRRVEFRVVDVASR